MVTEAINLVAHSVFSNKGVFALLLGSGLSRSAEIPTGWEITLDLIRQIAAMEGDDASEDPERWFIENKKEQPDYSSLLNTLPGTADERQSILSSYIEPSDEDREEGRKLPTKAHEAIARLVEKGYIRVIITTNFDRLLENALQKLGIEPVIISSDDDVKGAPPLAHGRCFIIKLHGDYLDTRIKNTHTELETYSKEMNKYLDQIFDQFGLITCGWSGAWDTALRNAIIRCPTRRFSTFWALKGNTTKEADELIKKRDAQTIEIKDANTFFDQLAEKIYALEDLKRPAPSDVRLATAMIKRYLSENKHRIRLKDSIMDQTTLTIDSIAAAELSGAAQWSAEEFKRRLKFYESKTEVLRAMASVGAFYSLPDQNNLWINLVKRLYRHYPYNSGTTIYLDLQRYPALILFYTLGVSAVAAENYDLLKKIFELQIEREYDDNQNATEVLLPYTFSVSPDVWKHIESYKDKRFPMSEHLCAFIKNSLNKIEPDEKQLEIYFDRFELLASLSHAYLQNKKDGKEVSWFPLGRYTWRFDRGGSAKDLTSFLEEAEHVQNKWLPLQSGMFGGEFNNYKIIKDAFNPFVGKAARRW